MSSGSTVFAALSLLSYVTGTTNTILDYAEQAGLADGAHINRFELTIRSSNPEWYCGGMQLFAFTLTDRFWNKNPITWGVVDSTVDLPKDVLHSAFKKAFKKWSERIPVVFKEPQNKAWPDIRIVSRTLEPERIIRLEYVSKDRLLDLHGVNIIFNDLQNWTDENDEDYRDLKLAAVFQVGRVMGLGDSDHTGAIMSPLHENFKKKRANLTLHPDDVNGIQFLYPNGP